MADTHKSPFGRMFMERFLQMTERISGSSSKASGKSAKETIAFLDLRKPTESNAGPSLAVSWETRVLSHGEDSTLNIGESPRDASECSSILEDNVPLKYYLSERACLGILRRSEEKGKPLDPLLKAVLERQAGVYHTPSKSEEDVPGGGKGALVQEDLSATLATNQDQVLFCPIDSHPQDKRVGFSKDGTVQTLPARMGTGGGNVPFLLQSVPAAHLRGVCDGRYDQHPSEPSGEGKHGSCGGSEEEGDLNGN